MEKPEIPYSLQAALAIMTRDEQRKHDVIGNIIAKLGNDVTEFVQSYDRTDLPFVIAAMQIIANGIMPILGEEGQGIVRSLVSNTQTVTMDSETFKKLMEEDK